MRRIETLKEYVIFVQGWRQDGAVGGEEDGRAGDGTVAPAAEHRHPRDHVAGAPDRGTGDQAMRRGGPQAQGRRFW